MLSGVGTGVGIRGEGGTTLNGYTLIFGACTSLYFYYVKRLKAVFSVCTLPLKLIICLFFT